MRPNRNKLNTHNIRLSQRDAGGLGDMPDDFLLSKFEETNLDFNENMINDYQRNILKDRRPDTTFFEHEKPRVNQYSQNFINARNMGTFYDKAPQHPEMFYGFIGPEHRDQRMYETDPLMNKMADMTYQYNGVPELKKKRGMYAFGSNSDGTVTGGNRNEWKTAQDLRAANAWTKQSLKVFSFGRESIDPQPLLPKPYIPVALKTEINDKKGYVNQDELQEAKAYMLKYGRLAQDPYLYKDTEFMKSMSSKGWDVAHYTIESKMKTTQFGPTIPSDHDTKFCKSEDHLVRAMGIIMADAVKNRTNTDVNIDGNSMDNLVTKSANINSDILANMMNTLVDLKYRQTSTVLTKSTPLKSGYLVNESLASLPKEEVMNLVLSKKLYTAHNPDVPFNSDISLSADEIKSLMTRNKGIEDLRKNRNSTEAYLKDNGVATWVYKSSTNLPTNKNNTDQHVQFHKESSLLFGKNKNRNDDDSANRVNALVDEMYEHGELDRKIKPLGNKYITKYSFDTEGSMDEIMN